MKPIHDKAVVDWITDLGVEIVHTRELPPQRLGAYLDDYNVILVRSGLSHALEQETLHHEYAHAFYRDRESTPTVERRAWVFAAKLLVDPRAYGRAEALSHDSRFIAQELGTTTRIVETYRTAMINGDIPSRAA